MGQKLNQSIEYSPSESPRRREAQSPVKSRPFFSPEPIPTYHNHYAKSTSFLAMKEPQTETNISCTSIKDVPAEWLLRFVLLCAEVEALRKKVGDKQAKVESMKSSIASKPNSNSTFINGLQSSHSSSQSGFYPAR